VIISGGGTGGHVFPAIAVAEELRRRGNGQKIEIVFLGTSSGLESTLVPQAGFPIHYVGAIKLKGTSLGVRLISLIKLPFYMAQTLWFFLQFKPHWVIGTGGYVSFIAVFAAYVLRRKNFILEQNSVPGLANRTLGRFVQKVFLTFAVPGKYFDSRKVLIVGNPLRQTIEAASQAIPPPKESGSKFTVLVLGGSQGALSLNEAFLQAMKLLGDRRFMLRIIHQTGKGKRQRVKKSYGEIGLDASVYEFIEDLENVYPMCDLVVSRAGAGGISEIMAFGKAAILVPYKFAADNHQWENGRVLNEASAAIILKDDETLAENLSVHIARLMDHGEELAGLAANARKMHQPLCAKRIVDFCFATTEKIKQDPW
jgi:UDP-N-acetylglucosamine--N-acetylmuramyl-(pentapeptide) pyrophosphoryl-undecaprenol N-acetylglucosamine transferase